MRIQTFPKFRDATYLQPQRVKIVIPIFSEAVPVWAGASTLLTQFPISNTDYYFSFKLPIAVFGTAFIAAIRWKVDDVCYRFKLWDNTLGILYYPVYAGEKIGLNAILEIWSINSALVPALATAKTLYSSQILFPEDATGSCLSCTEPEQTITLVETAASVLPPYAFCNPFCSSLCNP